MDWLEVRNAEDEVVWKSPEAEPLALETIGKTLKVIDLTTSQIIGGYILKPGERVVKMSKPAVSEQER